MRCVLPIYALLDRGHLLIPPPPPPLTTLSRQGLLELGAKARSVEVTKLGLSPAEHANLKLKARRFKQATAQQQYHLKMALASGRSYGKRGFVSFLPLVLFLFLVGGGRVSCPH